MLQGEQSGVERAQLGNRREGGSKRPHRGRDHRAKEKETNLAYLSETEALEFGDVTWEGKKERC